MLPHEIRAALVNYEAAVRAALVVTDHADDYRQAQEDLLRARAALENRIAAAIKKGTVNAVS